jgi:hypothetical protein
MAAAMPFLSPPIQPDNYDPPLGTQDADGSVLYSRLRDYMPTIQTIAIGLVLIGVARALQMSLLIFATTSRLSVFPD